MLSIPISHAQSVGLLDSLFIATSAVSTTGLTTITISDAYNTFGQLIVLLLFQVGGIGYMTFTSFILLTRNNGLTHWHQRVLGAEFSIPGSLDIKDFIRAVIVYTVMVESLGALGLYIAFTNIGMEPGDAVWSSIFHSVSAFCTAGFSLNGNSFEFFRDNLAVNAIISILAILGALGFIVATDFWIRITKRATRLSHTTKTILIVFVMMIVSSTAAIFLLQEDSFDSQRSALIASFFQAMTAMTTVGFNTVPTGSLSLEVVLIVILLMFIGASPSGTGGGMKSTTFAALFAIMWSKVRNNKHVTIIGKTIPLESLYRATTVFVLYSAAMFISTFLLSITENFQLKDIMFEATSAIGTVGLSTGITGGLSEWGKMVLIILMFIGRVGLLTFGLAFLSRKRESDKIPQAADLVV